jgi:F-type H+-transporting ATPase subunit epsilon
VLPERVTILAETALRPDEIDTAEAKRQHDAGEKAWHEAGDDAAKYDYANAQMREADEKLASAQGGA